LISVDGLIFYYPRVEQIIRKDAAGEPQILIDHFVTAGDNWRRDIPLEGYIYDN